MLLVLLMLLGTIFTLPAFADEGEETTAGDSAEAPATPSEGGDEDQPPEEEEEETSGILLAADAIKTYLTRKFLSREEKVESMNLMLTKGSYELYCDPFTGEIAVKNTVTGQIILSNPYDVANVNTESVRQEVLSQLSVTFENITDNGKIETMSSYASCAAYSQINVKNIKNGIRVEYTLGKIATKKLMPYWMEASRFEMMILNNIESDYERGKVISYYIPINYKDYQKPGMEERWEKDSAKYACVKKTYASIGFTPMYDDTETDSETGETVYVTHYRDGNGEEVTHKYKMSDNLAIWAIADNVVASEKMTNTMEGYVKSYCPDYTYEQRDFDIDMTGYTDDGTANANFHLALEYSLTDKGFEVSLPANGIRYDSSSYRLKSISVLPFMGASGGYDGKFEGYTFIPDGSGAIIRNEDILAGNERYTITGQMYGPDFAYHTLTYNGKSEILRMPIFGVVENAGTPFENGREIVPALNDDGTPSTDMNGNIIPQKWTVDISLVKEVRDIYDDYIMLIMVDEEGAPVYRDEENKSIVLEPVLDANKEIVSYLLKEDASKAGLNLRDIFYEINPTPLSGSESYYVMTPDGGYADLTTPLYDYTYQMQGFFAIIEEGDSLCEVTSEHGGGTIHGYNCAYITVHPESSDSYRLSDAISVGNNDAEWTVVSERKYVGLFKMQYIMLYGEDGEVEDGYAASYMGMANAYRDYLNLTKLTAEETGSSIPLYIESFGMLETQDVVATIPVWVDTPLTTFDDVKSMYGTLSEAGITNVNFRLKGFTSGGTMWPVPATTVKFEKVLGGNKGYTEIVKESEGKYGIFPEFDFANAWGSSAFDGFSYSKQTVRTIDDRYANKRAYDATYQAFQYNGACAVSASAYADIFEKFSEGIDKLGVDGVSASTMGSDLNSDFDEDDPYNREDNKELSIEMLQKLSEKYSNLMVDGGNAYSWKYVKHILNTSLDSSRYLRASQSIPFMGIVLHGFVYTAGRPTNMQGDTDYEILKLIENGANPYYTLSYQNTAELKEWRRLSQYYSVNFEIWQSELIAIYKLLNEALGDLQTSMIIDHEFVDGVRVLSASEKVTSAREDGKTLAKLLSDYNTALSKAIKDAQRAGELPEDFEILTNEAGVVQIPAKFIVKDEDGEDAVAEGFGFGYTSYDAYLEEKFVPYFNTDITDYTIVLETYENGTAFILNYNGFAVEVEVDGVTYSVGGYGFNKIAADGSVLLAYDGSVRALQKFEGNEIAVTNARSSEIEVVLTFGETTKTYTIEAFGSIKIDAEGKVVDHDETLLLLVESAADGSYTVTNYTNQDTEIELTFVINGKHITKTYTVGANGSEKIGSDGEPAGN